MGRRELLNRSQGTDSHESDEDEADNDMPHYLDDGQTTVKLPKNRTDWSFSGQEDNGVFARPFDGDSAPAKRVRNRQKCTS